MSAFMCKLCCCNECKYNAEIEPPLNPEEHKTIGDKSCFNCDDCYYYSNDESLSKSIIKYACKKFEMSDYYTNLKAKSKRKKFKII